ncbi:MAG: hypothetical protein V1810_02340 [Candidatus Beckwithbacteria bacterium]
MTLNEERPMSIDGHDVILTKTTPLQRLRRLVGLGEETLGYWRQKPGGKSIGRQQEEMGVGQKLDKPTTKS